MLHKLPAVLKANIAFPLMDHDDETFIFAGISKVGQSLLGFLTNQVHSIFFKTPTPISSAWTAWNLPVKAAWIFYKEGCWRCLSKASRLMMFRPRIFALHANGCVQFYGNSLSIMVCYPRYPVIKSHLYPIHFRSPRSSSVSYHDCLARQSKHMVRAWSVGPIHFS
jgi:hypothetical protein